MPSAENDGVIAALVVAGRIRADAATGLVYGADPTRPLGSRTARGYIRCCVRHAGKQFYFYAHRAVWIAHCGIPHPATPEIDHVGRDKADNRLHRLEAVTGEEDTRRAKAAGATGATARCHRGQYARATNDSQHRPVMAAD